MYQNIKWAQKLKTQFPAGQRVEMISVADTDKLRTSGAYLHYGFCDAEIEERKDYPEIPPGTTGTVLEVSETCKIEVLWDTGDVTKVAAGVDFIRSVDVQVIVRRPGEIFHMKAWELAQWANAVHQLAGGKGNPFSSVHFPGRLAGHHCSCGVSADGYTKGVFELLPLQSEDVRIGGKAYMCCTKCGEYSHL